MKTDNLKEHVSSLEKNNHEKYITYSGKLKEWDLTIDEVCEDIYTWPLLEPSFCYEMINVAEFNGVWHTDRHEFYPTKDVPLSEIGLDKIYNKILKEYVYEAAIHKWNLEGKSWRNLEFESFIIKYEPENQLHLSLHHDHSKVTSIVSLNDQFEGGGTFFERQKFLLNNPVGYVSIHPGNITHRHGARPITSGVRYVLVTFAN
jgi:hypothetical protein